MLAALGTIVPGGGLARRHKHDAAPATTAVPEPVCTPVPRNAATPIAPDAPIIPDQQFNAQLPPLTGDLNAPLPPIGALAPTAPPGAPSVPIAPGQTATPPGEDPALTRPLPPLASYETIAPADIADKGVEPKATLAYDMTVRGLDLEDLQSRFNQLSALKHGGGKAISAAQIAARGREDEELAVRLLKSAGYYDASAATTVQTVPNTPGRLHAILTATRGCWYKLGTITVSAAPTVPSDLIRRNLPLRTGEPIDAGRVQGAEANVSLVLPQNGYAFAKLGDRDILLDDQTFLGDYTLPVTVGPRGTFGNYSVTGKPAFDARHVGVLARFKPGELYDSRKVDDLRQALVATSLFAAVSVEPVQTGRPGPDGTEQVDLLVRENAGPKRALSGQLGYSTGQGIKAEGSFTNRNLFPPEGSGTINIIAGTQEQQFGVTFSRKNAGQRDRTVTLAAAFDHSSYDAFNALSTTLSGRISYDSTPIWQKKFTYAYGFELVGSNESVFDFNVGDRRRGTYFIAALPLLAQFDRSNDLLNPTKGYRLKVSLSPETSVRGAVSPYVRTIVETDGYFPAGDSIVLAGRARVGSILGIGRDELPPSRRYYGGGGGSVRGYGYQRLGPFDPQGNPVGGRSLNEFSVEARYRFGNFGIVPFFDGGNSYASSAPQFSDLRYGAGIGGRYYTNFGPLRIDVATPLNGRKGDGRIALYISIGQAF